MKQPSNLMISEFQSHGFKIQTAEGKTYRLNFLNAVNSDVATKYVHNQDSGSQITSCEPIYSKRDKALFLGKYPNAKGSLNSNLFRRLRNNIFFARAKTVGYDWDYASRFDEGDNVYPTGIEQSISDIQSGEFNSKTLYTICGIDDSFISVRDSAGNVRDIAREKFIPGLSEKGQWTDNYVFESKNGYLTEVTNLRIRPLKENEFIHVDGSANAHVKENNVYANPEPDRYQMENENASEKEMAESIKESLVIGEIIYEDSGEHLKFYDETEMLDQYKEDLSSYGPYGVRYSTFPKKDGSPRNDLNYKLSKVLDSEYGEDMQPTSGSPKNINPIKEHLKNKSQQSTMSASAEIEQ